jgi:hypothetical protein
VQPHPFPRQQVGQHRLAQQRVPEPVAAVVGDDQQVVVDRLGERGLEITGREATDGGDQLVPDPPSGDRRDPQHLLGRGRPLLHAGQQDVGQAQWQRLAVQPRGEQLLGVEGVALGPGHDVVDGRLRKIGGQPAHEGTDVGVREGGQLDPLDARQAHELGEQRTERMTAVQVVGAVGGDHGDRLVDQPGQQVAQQVAAGPVGPVHVLQDHQQGPGRRELADQAGHRLEELEPAVVDRLRRGAAGQRTAQVAALAGRHDGRPLAGTAGQEPGQHRVRRGDGRELGLPRDGTQQVDEGQIGQADVAEVDAVPGEHADPAGGRPGAQLVEQPGLADARVAREQDRRGAARDRLIDVRQQPTELLGPADDRGVLPAWHVVDRGTGLRQDGSRRHLDGPVQRARRRLRNQAPRRLWVPCMAAMSTSRR